MTEKNIFQALGMKETAARINTMIERAKETLKIPKNYPLDCVVSHQMYSK